MRLSRVSQPEEIERIRREYPEGPLVGVGGVVIHQNQVLLVRRGKEPLKGKWSIPGGLVELGEQLEQAVRRELREETGIDVSPLKVLEVVDRVVRKGKRVRYHYVIVDYACRLKRGRLEAGSDVFEAQWVPRKDLPRYRLDQKARSVVLQGFDYFERAGRNYRKRIQSRSLDQ